MLKGIFCVLAAFVLISCDPIGKNPPEFEVKDKPEAPKQTPKLKDYAYMDRFVCRKPLLNDNGEPILILGKIYIYTGHGMFEFSEDRDKVAMLSLDVADKHLQKIIEKK